MFGVVIILLVILTAIFAPFLAPYDPYDQDLSQSLSQPSSQHLLGTDALGRDTLSRLIFGSSNSLMVGIVALVIAAAVRHYDGTFRRLFGRMGEHNYHETGRFPDVLSYDGAGAGNRHIARWRYEKRHDRAGDINAARICPADVRPGPFNQRK